MVRERTTDEYAMVLNDLIRHAGNTLSDIDDIILSSVVPPLTSIFQELAMRYCNREVILLDHTLDLLVDNPWEIGSGRIATTSAAHHLYGGPLALSNMGAATKSKLQRGYES